MSTSKNDQLIKIKKIIRVGNSKAIIIPFEICKAMGLNYTDFVHLQVVKKEDLLILELVKLF